MNLRRLRQSRQIRGLTREIHVTPDSLMQPIFYAEGIRSREAVPGLPGVFRETADSLLKQTEADLKAGVSSVLLFGVPGEKRESGFSGEATARQISALKKAFGQDLLVAVDVCVCSYTTHGHCGVLNAEQDHVLNRESVDELAQLARVYAQAGADMVAPSDMMDGRIAAIRATLDQHNLERTLIMSYAAKFHSRFYGPFRAAADSAPKVREAASPAHAALKDRATYQIDPARPSDAFLSAQRDADEGADLLMVKPGLPYLDILARLSSEISLPWAVYEVSGEYAAIEALAEKGLIDPLRAHAESWIAFKRAGASLIITYGARNAREILKTLE